LRAGLATICEPCWRWNQTRDPILGVPIRIDATLCDPGEVWLESADGLTTTRVWPPPLVDD
jgi:hypothetical protein